MLYYDICGTLRVLLCMFVCLLFFNYFIQIVLISFTLLYYISCLCIVYGFQYAVLGAPGGEGGYWEL